MAPLSGNVNQVGSGDMMSGATVGDCDVSGDIMSGATDGECKLMLLSNALVLPVNTSSRHVNRVHEPGSTRNFESSSWAPFKFRVLYW